MKLLQLSFTVFAFASAEPARYGRNSDQDVEIQQVEVIEVPWQEEPQQQYGPPQQAGNPPQQAYNPPQQEYGPPQQEYGPPKQQYGPPQQEYGPPKPVYGPPPELTTTEAATTTTEASTTTTNYPTTTGSNSSINSTNNSTNSTRARLEREDLVEKGVYYIYHRNGALQRVVFTTKDDAQSMEYSAKLQYQNVEPIKGPIYSYNPKTYVFNRVNRK